MLEQQQYLLGKMNLPDAERATRIDLQKRIQAAVLGQGTWDDIPEPLKRQADTAWFQSFLRFTPASVMPKVKQPMLILQGEIDRQVPVHHAERLAELAESAEEDAGRRGAGGEARRASTTCWCAGKTGDLDEYPSLSGQGARPARGAGDNRLAGARSCHRDAERFGHRDTEASEVLSWGSQPQ